MNIHCIYNNLLKEIKYYFDERNKPKTVESNDGELRAALLRLNTQYLEKEASERPEGYRVLFEQKDTFQAKLIPMGNNFRKTQLLSGVPAKKEDNCPFCSSAVKAIKIFKDHCRSVRSHSGQILIIPDKHYAHWFEMPLEEQLALLQHAVALRKSNVDAKKGPLELHCGSAGHQTVFHTHLRTGIFKI